MRDRYANIFNKSFLCLILFLFVLMSASIAHAETYTFFTKWGSPGSGDGQFSVVWGVAVDSTGNVYATDINNNCIQKFNSSGTFITKWGSPGSEDEQFNQPFGVAVDSLGNVYVADTDNNRIQKFDSTGTFITKWGSPGSGDGQFQLPRGVAVDSLGNVYVADTNNNCIQKFSSTGTFITTWGSPGSGDGQFGSPVGVAVDSTDNIYILDQGTSRIQKFNSTGTFITTWGSSGSGDGQFQSPTGVAVDSAGNVYVADNGHHRIQKFNGTGAFITKWGSFGTSDGQLYYPNGVAVNSSGNVYVTDPGNQRIQVFVQVVLPAANFSSNVTSGYAPLSVQFSDSSENATSRNWDFGDGNNSTEQNPIHTYYTTGNYTVNLTASNANGTDSLIATITVLKVTPEITWNDPEDIVYGTPLSSTQLNASTSVNGTLTYSPVAGTVLGVGQHTLQVDFTPTDAANYTNVSQNVSINVTSATPTITWSNPDDIAYGTPLSSTQLNASASVDGNLVYTPTNGTMLSAGQHTLQAEFIPEDTTNYTNASANVTMNVTQATSEITWDNPADIVYGTALNGAQLNATASVNGSFVYTPENGTVLGVGQHTLHVDFTPTDAANYTNASKNVTINVTAQPVFPVANFSTNVTEGYAPLSVQFNDSSENATLWNWNFGDGDNSTERNPVHTFSTAGNYTVNLTASNANGTNSTLANITVFSLPVYPVANFNANVTAGDVPMSVQFNDSSTNATTWNWDFGDGNNSTEQNPVHTFSAAGNYTVNLTASNVNGMNSTKGTIIVSAIHVKIYKFDKKWGSEGTGDDQFKFPCGIAIDSSGYIYVADQENNRIEKYNSNGTFITKWGSAGTGDGQFGYPSGIAVDSSGNVYVIESSNHRVQKFNSSGAFITKWGSYGTGDGQFAYPWVVAVDSSDNVYVADQMNHRVQKFNSSGVFITKWGSEGVGDGNFNRPCGIEVDSSGNVYVTDSYNHRIQKFTSNGTFITKWGSSGTDDGQFNYPQKVAVDSSGNVYVFDEFNHRVQEFTSSGKFLTKWGSEGVR